MPSLPMTSRFLITGGSGYIGSHMALALMDAGHHAVLLDNLSNSSVRVLDRLRQLHPSGFDFVQADIRDDHLEEVFRRHPVDGVIHFAGLKSVGESRTQPLRYFDHNIAGTLRLLRAMDGAGVRRIVFSSSATVYEATQPSPSRKRRPSAQAPPMDTASWPAKTCCAACRPRIRAGRSPSCATSTPWAPTPAD
ncbi:MAG: SDR family NAD(P)-dependent oxidoreductase [Burkholderiaceae bacterium]|nr:MAG: SDR family NAD(P)-dependent oxidoreductase [Burkholderiaceae bacterium]